MNREQWMRAADTQHNPGEQPKTSLLSISTQSYRAQGYAHGATQVFELIDNSNIPDVTQQQAKCALDRINLDFELRCVQKIISGVASTSTLTGAAAWSAATSSSVISACNIAKETIRATTGYWPNLCIISAPALNALAMHPDFRTHETGVTVADRLGAATDTRVVVATAKVLTNQEGQANVFGDVWSTFCFFAYVDPNPGPTTATFAVNYRWPGRNSTSGAPTPELYQTQDTEAGTVTTQARFYQDEHVVFPELGHLILTGI
jgi:hypothetical protein